MSSSKSIYLHVYNRVGRSDAGIFLKHNTYIYIYIYIQVLPHDLGYSFYYGDTPRNDEKQNYWIIDLRIVR